MDKNNRFFTPTLYRMIRIDWVVIIIALSLTVALHWREVNWWRFWIMFWMIDIIGTAPGMYFEKRHPDRPVPQWCIVAYNVCHSFLTIAIVTTVWYLIGGLEWAMLGMPIHIAADRCVFGNIYKHLDYKFDPDPSPLFQRFTQEFRQAQKVMRQAGSDSTEYSEKVSEKGSSYV